jgi:3'(2'), 5'-bisphosphate nucleotidase
MRQDLDDHQLAHHVAVEAGAMLVALRTAIGATTTTRVLGARGDLESHHFIVDLLAQMRPDDAVLSEEGVDDRARLHRSRVWIVDPLDGTREFGELPRSDWAVHVALWSDGDLAAGAVAMPARDTVFSTAQPPRPLRVDGDEVLRIAVSRSRPSRLARGLADALGAELVPMGSAGVKAMAVVSGDVDLYVHSGGQYEWDSAAPVAVARSAGMHASRIDGAPLRYNGADAWLPDLLVCRPELSDRVLALVAQLR